jgi:hypothetical protein
MEAESFNAMTGGRGLSPPKFANCGHASRLGIADDV